MATAQNIIDAAYKKIGYDTLTTGLSNDALVSLNNMLGIWSIDGLLVPYKTTENFPLVVGQSSYTIGASANFNTVRPLEIIYAYIRDSSNVDHLLSQISQQKYVSLTNKTADGRPERFYYDPQYSSGKIYFDKEPAAVETLYIVTEKALLEIATLATDVVLPDFYKEALVFNLAVRLALDTETPVNKYLADLADRSKQTIENYVAKDKMGIPIPLDSALIGGKQLSDITSG